MYKRTVLLAAVAAVILMMSACTQMTTVSGKLVLQPGQTGDVQNSRVELYEKSDLTGTPVKFVASKAGTISESEFELEDVIEGYYYLLAWKDLNNDATLGDGDMVGIHGGTYRPGYGGTQLTVSKGKDNDAGTIEMMVLKLLKLSMSGVRFNGNLQTDFSYSFNYDCTITSASVTFPGNNPINDPDMPGAKTAGTTYHTIWNAGGAEMPTGQHIYVVNGTWEGGSFSDTIYIQVN